MWVFNLWIRLPYRWPVPWIGQEALGDFPVSYTHLDAADDLSCVDLGGRRIIKKIKC